MWSLVIIERQIAREPLPGVSRGSIGIGIDLLAVRAPVQVRPGPNARDTYLTRMSLHDRAVDVQLILLEYGGDAPRAEERVLRVTLIDAMLERYLSAEAWRGR
jgi:hypothetical protein